MRTCAEIQSAAKLFKKSLLNWKIFGIKQSKMRICFKYSSSSHSIQNSLLKTSFLTVKAVQNAHERERACLYTCTSSS